LALNKPTLPPTPAPTPSSPQDLKTSRPQDLKTSRPQDLKTTFTITLEVRAHRVGIDQQNFRHRLGRPAGRQQHHSLDAVGLAFVSGAAVCLTQLGELVR